MVKDENFGKKIGKTMIKILIKHEIIIK